MYENIHSSWNPLFERWKDKIDKILEECYEYPSPIYPPREQVFRVFEMSVDEIQIVLLGQDPYHKKGQANGFAFSVNKDIKTPPSLANIYKELAIEYPERNYYFKHGDLSQWFYREKIFLLNASLTVMESSASIFMKQWKPFTDDVIKFIYEHNNHCIFLLLGDFAKEKAKVIDDNNRIVTGIHPSPLSAYRGFFESNIFKKIEEKVGHTIDWSIEN